MRWFLLFILFSYTAIADVNLSNELQEKEAKIHQLGIKNIVFSGGGVLGIAYLGSLEAIEKKIKPLNSIQKFAGTSVGSIIATMSALRYSASEMKNLIRELDFKKIAEKDFTNFAESKDIFDDESIDLHKVIAFIINKDGSYGINDGDFLEDWIENIIAKKVGKRHATFADMVYNSEFTELYITAAEINKEKLVVFSAINTPDIIISKAVRASISIPMLFDVVKIGDGIYVDGGMYNLFSFRYFQ